MISTIEDEIKNVSCLLSAFIVCLCYCNLISARLPKGKWRLISVVPIFYVFTILPLYTTSAIFTFFTAGLITWLANFRLLLFAFNQGPLASACYNINLPIFIALTALPFRIKPKNDVTAAPEKFKNVVPLSLATQIPVSFMLASAFHNYKEHIHPCIELVLHCVLGFSMIEIVVEFSSLLVRALTGLELEPASDKPYLSTSLQEFWGRRWNLTFGGILRDAVHKPVLSATATVLGRDWAALPGILAAFLVSGLMHELIVWYVTRTNPTWEVTMFFVVHGVCVMVQRGLKVALPEMKWRLPWFVSRLLTLGFVVGTSYGLLLAPVMRSGAAVTMIEEFVYMVKVGMEYLIEFWAGTEIGLP